MLCIVGTAVPQTGAQWGGYTPPSAGSYYPSPPPSPFPSPSPSPYIPNYYTPSVPPPPAPYTTNPGAWTNAYPPPPVPPIYNPTIYTPPPPYQPPNFPGSVAPPSPPAPSPPTTNPYNAYWTLPTPYYPTVPSTGYGPQPSPAPSPAPGQPVPAGPTEMGGAMLIVHQLEVSKDGYSTFMVSLDIDSSKISDVYAIFGDEGSEMTFPAAFQLDAPWGSNVGPVCNCSHMPPPPPPPTHTRSPFPKRPRTRVKCVGLSHSVRSGCLCCATRQTHNCGHSIPTVNSIRS
eukprot:COSAG02_NODE_1195_length_13940_cov_15.482407_8_plen_287_part_00